MRCTACRTPILRGAWALSGVFVEGALHLACALTAEPEGFRAALEGTGSPAFTRVTFTGNSSTGGAGGGLNVQTLGGPGLDEPNLPTLLDVVFANNTSVGGGGMFNNNSQSTLNRVTFSGNTATRRGGGMLNEFSSPTLTNVTFSGNTSTEASGATPWGGGGMMNIGADPVLNNVTFNGNNSVNGSGTAGGDAIKNVTLTGSASTPVIQNSILWGDGGINDEVRSEGTSSATIEDNNVQGGCPALATCANVINSDPVLSALANNGGYTQTMAISVTGAADDAGRYNYSRLRRYRSTRDGASARRGMRYRSL